MRNILSILLSIALGVSVYFFYRQYITGLNLFLMASFAFVLLLLLFLNILLIRKSQSVKKKMLTAILISGVVVALFFSFLKEDNSENGNPRVYLGSGSKN
ncbi:hypothetical protein HDF19_07865 [Mucilaginibacter sp. E4BP6]|uniref:hypothetical protein n=1 Tax=Mucilaginibacter sp. E4BP6 TaxID=2723089 RepID=UPI0015CB8327|nr:hypothetical protein [Mucilaginibacter sp. E4BP6]NYE67525.1 cytochrome bd-type quinol oxidase subunit 2 [Mucilaginibacter sp. E4BP6]